MTAAVILGTGSGIAQALAHRMATGGMPLLLAGRDVEALADDAADLRIRYGVEVHVLGFEADDFDGHELFLDRCWERLGDRLDTVVLCYGSMFDQAEAEADFSLTRRMIDVNYASPVSVLGRAGARLADRGGGTISPWDRWPATAADRATSSTARRRRPWRLTCRACATAWHGGASLC